MERPDSEVSVLWRGCYDLYRLDAKDDSTELHIESSVPKDDFRSFQLGWDDALQHIKDLAEEKAE